MIHHDGAAVSTSHITTAKVVVVEKVVSYGGVWVNANASFGRSAKRDLCSMSPLPRGDRDHHNMRRDQNRYAAISD